MEYIKESGDPRIEQLLTYDAQEEILREHYLKHGSYLLRQHFPSDIKQEVLTDAKYISAHTDISIVKHPRYLGPFDHSHTFFEISYVLSGTCSQIIYGNDSEEHFVLHSGDVIILPPSISHSIQTADDSLVINILMRKNTFDSAFLQRIPDNNALSNFFTDILYSKTYADYLIFRTEDNPLIRSSVYDILAEYYSEKTYMSDILNQLLGLLFLYLLRECGNQIEISGEHDKETQLIPAIIHYLEKHYSSATISELADHFGYSNSHLCRLYKNYTGVTLRETLIHIQMRHSGELLLKSDWSVETIAEKVGYQDVSSFIRRFHKHFGITPLQYRRQG